MTEQNRFPVEKPSAINTEVSGNRVQDGDGPAQSELQERILEFGANEPPGDGKGTADP